MNNFFAPELDNLSARGYYELVIQYLEVAQLTDACVRHFAVRRVQDIFNYELSRLPVLFPNEMFLDNHEMDNEYLKFRVFEMIRSKLEPPLMQKIHYYVKKKLNLSKLTDREIFSVLSKSENYKINRVINWKINYEDEYLFFFNRLETLLDKEKLHDDCCPVIMNLVDEFITEDEGEDQ